MVYLPTPPGWQPWNIPSTWQVVQWNSEVYAGGGTGIPPDVNTAILAAQCAMGSFTVKVWILADEVRSLGGP